MQFGKLQRWGDVVGNVVGRRAAVRAFVSCLPKNPLRWYSWSAQEEAEYPCPFVSQNNKVWNH